MGGPRASASAGSHYSRSCEAHATTPVLSVRTPRQVGRLAGRPPLNLPSRPLFCLLPLHCHCQEDLASKRSDVSHLGALVQELKATNAHHKQQLGAAQVALAGTQASLQSERADK